VEPNASLIWVQVFPIVLSGFGAGFGEGVGVADATAGEKVTPVRIAAAAMRPTAPALRVFCDIDEVSFPEFRA
jgi:hypothetical protein